MRSIDSILDEVIAREEPADPAVKVINRPADEGGLTSRYGVTFDGYNRWRKQHGREPVTPVDFGDVCTREEAKAFMLENIAGPIIAVQGVDEALFASMLDWAETSGPDDPTRALQRGLRRFGKTAAVDGIFGLETLVALKELLAADPEASRKLRRDLAIRRGEYYVLITTHDAEVKAFREKHPTTNLENLHGWYLRAMESMP